MLKDPDLNEQMIYEGDIAFQSLLCLSELRPYISPNAYAAHARLRERCSLTYNSTDEFFRHPHAVESYKSEFTRRVTAAAKSIYDLSEPSQ